MKIHLDLIYIAVLLFREANDGPRKYERTQSFMFLRVIKHFGLKIFPTVFVIQ